MKILNIKFYDDRTLILNFQEFSKNFFLSWKTTWKNFLGQIGFQFFALHRSAFFSMIFQLASVHSKMLNGHLQN